MQRQPLPSRTVGLARTTTLKRNSKLAKAIVRTGVRNRPVVPPGAPKKPKATKDIPQDVREVVRARSGGRCEAGLVNVCHGTATNMHHRRRRNITPAHTVPNLMHLCGSGTTGCHGWITAHPAASKEPEAGWIVPTTLEPENEPVRIRGRLCWLTDDGRYVVAGPR